MKRILLLLFIGLTVLSTAKAQFPMGGIGAGKKVTVTGRITALILDSITKKPVDYATIALVKIKDNKSVNGGVTDEKGKIALQNIAPDQYKLTIGFMGYKTKSILVKTTPEKLDLNVGTIYLVPTAGNLKEVEITGQKALVESKVDKLVYNAEADITNAGGDATDVMRKVPMLSVDINGNLQMRGAAVRVLINGKPSGTMANSVADALKMIPAEQIKSVEVITSPSAKYDAEGSGGIVNIITKKKNAEGISGSLNGSVGTRSNNGAFNLNAKTGRLSLTTSLGVNQAYPQNSKVDMLNTYIENGQTNTLAQNGYSNWSRVGYNGSAGLDYDINAYNNISTNIKFNRFSNGGPGSTDIYLNNAFLSTNTRDMDMSFNNMDWNVDYKKTTKREGEEFTLSGQLSRGRNISDYSNVFTKPNTPDSTVLGDNTGKNNEYTLQADYTYPFNKTTTLETGAKGIFRNIKSNDGQIGGFDYDQNVAAAYGVMGFKLSKKITAKAGLRAEYTAIDGKASNFKNDYFNLFPSIIVSQTLKANTTIKASYNRRVQRPSLFYLNPFRNESDVFNPSQGNPNLAPELTDNMELGYSTFIKGSIINASVFYRRTHDVIESAIRPIVEDGVNKNLTTYINVGNSKSYGFNIFASYNPKPKWTLMTNLGLNTYEVNGSATGVSTSTFLNYTAFLRSAYALPGGWNTELWGVLNSPKRTFQGKTDAMYFYGAALKKEILNKKASVGLNVLNPFNRDLRIKTLNTTATSTQSTDIHYPLRSFGVNFSYSFGKLKFTQKKKINNDDVKQGEQQMGEQGAGGLKN
ncbi:TonB-dependent receptor [Pedobacter sp. HMWF019]|uniref:outer membrane beta-barrel family protein n=1 Tax=Pedobacter sp. HMWF019 TaxID=2056856 RepID=UPI000D34FD46|nr:outer membrane beta-barrel family protein [Pedobacter sp. HMWF019]PTS94582.1 TonB-dependent receptor [Pedobacter sp. HMWF019]